MPNYQYSAQNDRGENVNGRLSAADEMELARILFERNLYMVSATIIMEPAATASRSTAAKPADSLSLEIGGKINLHDQDILFCTHQLEIALTSGVSIMETVDFISRTATKKPVRALFQNVRNIISQGNTLSDALHHASDSFPPLYINLVRVGETSGAMPECFTRLLQYLEKTDRMIRNIRSGMIYPAIILSAAGIVIIFMTVFILPVFTQAMGIPRDRLPMLTLWMLNVSEFLRHYWYVPIAGFIGLWKLIRLWIRNEGNRRTIDRVLLKMPYLGQILQKIYVTRFISSFALMYERGIPVMEAIRVSRDAVRNKIITEEIDRMLQNVQEGKVMSEAIMDSMYFPPLVGRMIATGEMSGKLPEALEKVANYFDREVEQAIKDFFVALEPLIILILGGAVGIIAAGLLLPILTLSEHM